MSEKGSSLFTDLSQVQMELVDEVCLRFENAWKQGKEPRLEDFLTDVEEPTRSVLQEELASLDRDYRQSKLWYWNQEGKGAVRGGPFSWTELKDFAVQGRLVGRDSVRSKGMDEWMAAADVLDVFSERTKELHSGAPVSGAAVSDPTGPPRAPSLLGGPGEKLANGEPLTHGNAPSGDATVQRAPAVKPPISRTTPSVPGYEIEGVLGRGAMGKVFKARQTQLGGRLVALKVIVTGQVAAVEELARFRLEADSLASLNNPNIVQVYEVGEWFTGDGTATLPFFSMEYVAGGTLSQRLGKTPQPPREAAHLLAVLARAVHAAHVRGIIHRDLKPGNILLAAEPAAGSWRDANGDTGTNVAHLPLSKLTPKISDFGLAKHLHADADLTQTGRLLGTPNYMAPEQAMGRVKETGPATDVYALGCILYEMLTGRPPFTGADDAKETIPVILEQIRNQDPIPPGRLVGRLPRDLETICSKCLHKEAGKRYPTAQALAEDLDRFLANRPIKARPVGVTERTWRWCRRNPTIAGLTATLIVLALTSVAGVVYLWLDALHQLGIAERQRIQANIQNAELNKVTTFDPGPVQQIGLEEFRAEGKMTQNGFLFQLTAGKAYIITLRSSEGQPYFFILDSAGKLMPDAPVTRRAEFGGFARLQFVPPRDDIYRVMVAFRETGIAQYVLAIRERGANEPPGKFFRER